MPASTAKHLSSTDLEDFIKSESMPLMDEVNGSNYGSYASAGLPLAYLFVDLEDPKRDELVDMLKPFAKKHKGKVNFVWIDAIKFADHGKSLGLSGEQWPAFTIQDIAGQLKYPFQGSDLDSKSVGSFLDKFVAGKLQPTLKSEKVPETQDESVYTVVGSTFDEVIYDDDKDVFVEFYAPWCGHCKRLKPTWDQLGDHYADVKDRIMIAKMDATENDVPPATPFQISGFPTIKFKQAGSREWIDFDGDRTLESMIEFVDKTAKNPLDITLPFKGKTTTAAAADPTGSPQVVLEDEHAGHEHHDEL